MSTSKCCFLTYIQVSQEAGQVVWCSHLFQYFPVYCDPHSHRLYPSVTLHCLKDENWIPWEDIEVIFSFTFPTSALLKFPFPFHPMTVCSLFTHFCFLTVLKFCNYCFLTLLPHLCSFIIMHCALLPLKLTNLYDKHLLCSVPNRDYVICHYAVHIYHNT